MTLETLIAYHGDPKLKETVLAKIAMHRAADTLAQGAYVHDPLESSLGKTTYCAVGCLLEDPAGGHARYKTEFGIPTILAYLEDSIFESLDEAHAKSWPEQFMGAISPGADLSMVWANFAIWLMADPSYGITKLSYARDIEAICKRIENGYQRIITNRSLSEVDAKILAKDAWQARIDHIDDNVWFDDGHWIADIWFARDQWGIASAAGKWAFEKIARLWELSEEDNRTSPFMNAASEKLLDLIKRAPLSEYDNE